MPTTDAQSTPPHAGPSGLLVIDKPAGPTSMAICAGVRARLRRGGAPKRIRVGHGGALDPFATGVLVLMIGKATRLCDRVMAGEKEYVAEVDLSATSTTDDPEGERTSVLPPRIPTEADVRRSAAGLVGRIMQRPPAYSAIHVAGRRAYQLARAGRPPELPARPVIVHGIVVEAYEWPRLVLRVRSGKGVYIRSLARDLGAAMGCGGMLTALRRTRVGPFAIDQARTPGSLPDPLHEADLLPVPALPIDEAGLRREAVAAAGALAEAGVAELTLERADGTREVLRTRETDLPGVIVSHAAGAILRAPGWEVVVGPEGVRVRRGGA